MRRAALAVAAAALLGAAPAAHAEPSVWLEAGVLMVSGDEGDDTIVVAVSDDGRTARVDAASSTDPRCALDAGAMACTQEAPLRRVHVRGESGDDRIELRGGVRSILDGGPGEDVVLGGSGPDRLVAVYGYGTGELERDVLDGRAGVDTAGFTGTRESLRIDLDDGYASAGDVAAVLRAVERAQAGSGDDVLRGDEHANVLGGGAGDDRLIGEEGDDVLEGGGGDDLLDGGFDRDVLGAGLGDDALRVMAGDRAAGQDGVDRVTLRGAARLRVDGDRQRDRVRCTGSGARIVADVGDALRGRCDAVTRRRVIGLVSGAPEARGFALRLAPEQLGIWCGAAAEEMCRGTIVLRSGRRTAGRGAFRGRGTAVELAGWAQRRLDAGRRLPVVAIATRRPAGLPARNLLVLLPSTKGSDV